MVVDKPAGWTSHDVVGKLRRFYGQRRVGHAGTLDPDATGVLLVGLGRVTRLLRFLQETTKTYEARVVVGIATDTLDAPGAVLERAEMPLTRPGGARLPGVPRRVAADPTDGLGDQGQGPASVRPRVAGRRSSGRRGGAHRPHRGRGVRAGPVSRGLGRAGLFEWDVRARFAADLGAALGRAPRRLRRTRVGSFGVDEAYTLEAIEADPLAHVVTPRAAMRDLETIVVRGDEVRAIAHGATFASRALVPEDAGVGPFAVVDDAEHLLAVYERRGAGVKPVVVLAEQQ